MNNKIRQKRHMYSYPSKCCIKGVLTITNHLFRSTVHGLFEKHFRTFEEVNVLFVEWFSSKGEWDNFTGTVIYKLTGWYTRVASDGQYFEKQLFIAFSVAIVWWKPFVALHSYTGIDSVNYHYPFGYYFHICLTQTVNTPNEIKMYTKLPDNKPISLISVAH